MAEIIRRIEEKDFEEVSKIYEFGNDVEELKWLYRDLNDTNVYNAFVAVTPQNEIIGAIGYWSLEYYLNKRKISCICPVNWMVKSGHKGMAGVLLFRKVSDMGDINIIVEGTNVAQKLFPMFKYKTVAFNNYYYKVLNIVNFFKGIQRSSLLMKLGMFGYLLPSFFKLTSKKKLYKNIQLVPYDGNNYAQEIVYEKEFQKKVTKNHIDWLLDCPDVKTMAFVIKKGDKNLGTCVLYMKKVKKVYKGRIIQLPYLGDDKKLWITVINKCNKILKDAGASIVSIVALDTMTSDAIENLGFIKVKRHSQPIHLKDKIDILPSININRWYFQFTDGEISFRNF